MDLGNRNDAMGRALHDVPVPDGLQDRLLAALLASGSVSSRSPQNASEPVVSLAPARGAVRRRWLVVGAGVALLLLAVAVVPGLWRRTVSPASAEELVSVASLWGESLSENWNSGDVAPPDDHRLDRQVRARSPRWQTLSTPYDSRTVAYDLRHASQAWLFVAITTAPFLEDGAACQRLPSSGGWGVGAWRRGSQLYVLLVREDRQRLEDFLIPTSPTVAASARGGHVGRS